MPFKFKNIAVGLVLAAAITPQVASAQAGTAADPLSGGPIIPGFCVVDSRALFQGSKAGQAASRQLDSLIEQARVQEGLPTELASIQAEGRALNAAQGKLTPAQIDARAAKLRGEAAAYNQKIQDLQARHDRTLAAVDAQISQAARPVVVQAYVAHRCGLLLDRAVMMAGNPGHDLTAEIIRGMDVSVTAPAFDLQPSTPAGESAQ